MISTSFMVMPKFSPFSLRAASKSWFILGGPQTQMRLICPFKGSNSFWIKEESHRVPTLMWFFSFA